MINLVLKNLLSFKTQNDNHSEITVKDKKSNFFVNIFNIQYKYIKTQHTWHLVDPSPWPLVAALAAFFMTSGGVLYMQNFLGGGQLLVTGFILLLYVMFTWWRDIVREATYEDQHTFSVQRGLRLGMVLFIVSEIMFFFAFFWAFFHSSLSPTFNIGGIWPPESIVTIETFGIPLTNTVILLSSGATVTWAHHALIVRAKKHALISLILTIILAAIFTFLQGLEYVEAPFTITDSVFGSCFYMATGFHGFHVFVGTCTLMVSLIRLIFNHFTNTHHFGFESAAWYWHFVDVVWLFLFITVYWWGGIH
uniref:Cytochrome c oxidase subunit 3 n=1 Tax=Trieres regia TaxID=1335017 RepID=A0A7T4WR13_9STRA|nr:cytochrome c oxidase subunit 3 [Odontella regia]QQD79301.1 cytochrome c oxidase subunit 3 [Odontella regia]